MGAKRVLQSLSLFSAQAVTGTNTYTSATFDVHNLDSVGFQISWTGAMVGTITINGSIDGVNFYPLTFSPALTQPNNNATGYIVSLQQVPWPYLNVVYVNSSSSGNLTIYASGKDLN